MSMAKQFISIVKNLKNFVKAHQLNHDYFHEYLNLHMTVLSHKWWWNQDKDTAAILINTVLSDPSYCDKLKSLVQYILDTFVQIDEMDDENDDFPQFSSYENRDYTAYGY